MPKENGWTHVDPRYRICQCRLYSRQSRRHQRLSCFASLLLSFSSRAVTKENPHQPAPLHTVVDNSTTVVTIGRRGGTEYPYDTSELSPSLVNGSRNDLLVLTLLFKNGDPLQVRFMFETTMTPSIPRLLYTGFFLLLLNTFLMAVVGT